MKCSLVALAVALTLLIALPAGGQPVPEPKEKAPVTKAEPKATAPATAPVEAKKPEVKTEGKVEVVDPKSKKKAEGDDVAAPVETEGKGYAKVALNHAIKLGFLLVFLLLSGLIRVLMKKFGFQEHTAKVDDVLKRAKNHAEQWSVKKAGVEGAAKPGGPERMDKAVNFALDLARDYKLPEKGKEWWEDQLESWIGMEKNGA
jgi:hypothetical protein